MIYSDLNAISPTKTPKLNNIQAIYQSLHNIFSTRPGQRLFEPEFGFDIDDELFELMDTLTEFSVLNRVINTVTRWESRVTIDTAKTTITGYPEQNKYELFLVFSVNGVSEQNFEFRASFAA
jgi:phage baseplate assembly protein W